MQYAALVGHAQRPDQREADPRGLAGVDGSFGRDAVRERIAVDQLHDDVRQPGAGVLDDVVHDDHVRVDQLGHGPGLPQRPLAAHLRVGGGRAGFVAAEVEFLDGDLPVEQFVRRLPDGAHAAAAQPVTDAITPGDQAASAHGLAGHAV